MPSYMRVAASPRWSQDGDWSGSLAAASASERMGDRRRFGDPAQAALAFATWVAIASISAGDRQS